MAQAITPLQLRALQTLWSQRMAKAGISDRDEAREMRHTFIASASGGRARETKELSFVDARKVISLLAGTSSKIADAAAANAAAKHGRKDDDGSVQMLVGDRETGMLGGVTKKLGWDARALEGFIARQLAGQTVIRTVGDFNKVFWPMKRMLRAAKRQA